MKGDWGNGDNTDPEMLERPTARSNGDGWIDLSGDGYGFQGEGYSYTGDGYGDSSSGNGTGDGGDYPY